MVESGPVPVDIRMLEIQNNSCKRDRVKTRWKTICAGSLSSPMTARRRAMDRLAQAAGVGSAAELGQLLRREAGGAAGCEVERPPWARRAVTLGEQGLLGQRV